MIDEVYRNAFQEVYIILGNTEDELLRKVPDRFMNFINNNRNINYQINIKSDIQIDKQILLKETESILALIYRSYWATDDEKREFAQQDLQEKIEIENKKQEEYSGKDVDEIFKQKQDINKTPLDNSLTVVKKENFIKRFFNKLLKIFKK